MLVKKKKKKRGILGLYITHLESLLFSLYVRAIEELIYTYVSKQLIALD